MLTRPRIVSMVSWLLVLPAVGWAALRVAGWDSRFPLTQLMAFTPYVAAAATVPMVAAVSLRRWWQGGVALLTVVILASCVLPRWFADGSASAGARGPRLRVLTANVLAGSADPAHLVRLAREYRVDVLALQELTPPFLAAANAAGLAEPLPFQFSDAAAGTVGSGLASRFPLTDHRLRVNPGEFRQTGGTVSVPGGPVVLLESAHPFSPYDAEVTGLWRQSMAGQPAATVDGPLRVLLGDFNSTLDHRLMRDLIGTGYRDAADVVGAGFAGTWGPYDGDRIPPVVIDHVLADRRIGVGEVRVLDLAGSDHRAVLAVLILP